MTKIPIFIIIGGILWVILTSNIFATRSDVEAQVQELRYENSKTYLPRDEAIQQLSEIKTTLQKVSDDVEQIKINQAKRGI